MLKFSLEYTFPVRTSFDDRSPWKFAKKRVFQDLFHSFTVFSLIRSFFFFFFFYWPIMSPISSSFTLEISTNPSFKENKMDEKSLSGRSTTIGGTLVHLARCEIRLGRSSSNQIPVNSLIGLGRKTGAFLLFLIGNRSRKKASSTATCSPPVIFILLLTR